MDFWLLDKGELADAGTALLHDVISLLFGAHTLQFPTSLTRLASILSLKKQAPKIKGSS